MKTRKAKKRIDGNKPTIVGGGNSIKRPNSRSRSRDRSTRDRRRDRSRSRDRSTRDRSTRDRSTRGRSTINGNILSLTLEEVTAKARANERMRRSEYEAEANEEIMTHNMFEELHKQLQRLGRDTRRNCNTTFIPKDVVPGKVGYYASMPQVDTRIIDEFVDYKIEKGPQLVTLPVGGSSHIILVDVQDDQIMISDWRGRKFVDSDDPGFRNYKEMITALQEKYNRDVKFFFLDPVLLEIAEKKSDENDKKGGCSEYAYAWSGLYYKNGHYEWPFPETNKPEGHPYLRLLYNKSDRYKKYR
jgi:hypothetical protein